MVIINRSFCYFVLAKLEADNEKLEADNEKLVADIEKLHGELREKDGELREKDRELREKDAEIAELKARLHVQDAGVSSSSAASAGYGGSSPHIVHSSRIVPASQGTMPIAPSGSGSAAIPATMGRGRTHSVGQGLASAQAGRRRRGGNVDQPVGQSFGQHGHPQ
jgi:hypothetical protein